MARYLAASLLALAAAGCSETSLCDGFGVECAGDEAVVGAMTTVEGTTTWSLLQRNGDGLAARIALLERGVVPGASTLVEGGERAATLMRARLRTGDDYAVDHALVVYAWALGEMGDEASLETLADFVELTSFGSDLHLAPHAATDAIHQILGDDQSRRNTLLDYSLLDRDAAVTAARAGTVQQPQTTKPPSCQIRFTMATENGTPITYQRNGQTFEASFECTRFANPVVPDAYRQDAIARVTAGGGTYVDQSVSVGGEIFPLGEPNRVYNCAGYSFRELTTEVGLNCNAPNLLDILTSAGLLTAKPISEATAGDKIFFRPKSGYFSWWPNESAPAHVAEVHSAAGGDIVVRAPDNQTGVFDAPLGAAYFQDWEPYAYEWTNGVVPRVITTVDGDVDARYCSDECAGGCSDSEVCLDGACVPKTEQTSCELRTPQCCPGQDNSCTAPDAACFCDAYCVTANDCCPDACSVCGYCG